MRGPYRTATKLATMNDTRAKQPKHRRGRRAQARASHSRVASSTRGAGAAVGKSREMLQKLHAAVKQAGSFLLSDDF